MDWYLQARNRKFTVELWGDCILEDDSYSILNQRAIIDLLIQGDIFPYMTGSEIQDIGMKFKVFWFSI